MIVISRRKNESIVIGNDIEVTILVNIVKGHPIDTTPARAVQAVVSRVSPNDPRLVVAIVLQYEDALPSETYDVQVTVVVHVSCAYDPRRQVQPIRPIEREVGAPRARSGCCREARDQRGKRERAL